MKKAAKVFFGIVLTIVIIICTIMVIETSVKKYNESFPEKYISETYPDAEILKSGYTGGFMFDPGNLYYECRDKKTGMKFHQEFTESGLFGKLESFEDSAYGYNVRSKEWNAENTVIEKAEKCLSTEHFIIHNPLNTSGIVIIVKNESAENIDSLITELNSSITEINKDTGIYTAYTVISCDDRLYSEMKQLDFDNLHSGKSGQCDFFDIARKMDIQFERITSKNISALDYDTYNAKGDPNDENYVSPDNFDETAVSINGGVNSVGDQHMWIFGVKFP